MTRFRSALAWLGLALLWPAASMAQLGTLVHDGPVTPEQVSMYLPVTGTLSATTGTVRYRPTGSSTWTDAHPMYRIRPAFTDITVPDAFAGVITGLTPGQEYTVEVTIDVNGTPTVKTLVVTTRALPPPAGAPNKTIATGSTLSQIQAALDGLVPGDVIQFQNGTYTIDLLEIRRSGTDNQPIYIRGQSRSGVVLKDSNGGVIRFSDASNVVLEDLTLEGSNVDSDRNSTSEGVRLHDGWQQRKVTLRRLTIRGVDKGIAAEHSPEQILVYDCTMTGNNLWNAPFTQTGMGWNDDGVRVPGHGIAIFNNTMTGFGDTFAVADLNESYGVHFYRNDIRFTVDDAFEGDYGHRNMTFYDNRVENSMTLCSFDPLHGGPAYVFRNISINTGRSPFKFNSENSGHFIYNNTIVRTTGAPGAHETWGWIQFNNGPQRAWAYRNNILIYYGQNKLFGMESEGNSPIDFTNNAWYPDAQVWWSNTGGSYTSLSQAYNSLPATQPLFGTSTRRHQNDRISEQNPFVVPITLGIDYLTFISTPYTPAVASGTAPRASGVPIPGITDGYSGAAPDMGAIITGRPVPIYGDRSGVVVDAVAPATTSDLRPR